ncbi:MAG: GNAT family N-acetyltransferase [Candidatus Saccharibacteria bacterium]
MSEITVYDSWELDQREWRDLQHLTRQSFQHLDRTNSEIDELVSWDNPGRFYRSHMDPNSEVGEAFNANQDFRYPKVAVARQDGEPTGFAYSAHNVSGASVAIREAKHYSIIKNYLWLREVVVDPMHRERGVGTALVEALLRDKTTIPYQPVATYIWPSEMPTMQSTLERRGFRETGSQRVKLFGHAGEVVQTRMQARSVRGLLGSISAAQAFDSRTA